MDKFAFHVEMLCMTVQNSRSSRSIFWVFNFFVGSIFFSCANEDCVSIANNYYLVGFFESELNNQGEYPKIDTLFYSVTADGNDVVFYDPDTSVSVLSLPVNPSADRTSFELIMLDSISKDSLNNPVYHINPNPHYITVNYKRSQRIISEECGVEINYSKIKIEEITFEDTLLVSDRLSRLNEANVKVFF